MIAVVKGEGMRKKHIKDVVAFGALGLAVPLGSKVISQAGGDASGLKALGDFQPAIGTLVGTKITLDMLQDISKPFNKTRRRR